MELVLIRHGLPERLVSDDGSPVDPALVEMGWRQAEAVAEWLCQEAEGRLDALYSSPLRRARETAAPLAKRLGFEPVIDDDLAELDRDSGSYIPVEELRAIKDERWLALISGEYGQDRLEFHTRVVGALERIVGAHRGQRVVVVCHGGVINAYAAHVLGIATTDGVRSTGFFLPEYTSITRVLAASSGHRAIHALNEIAHLRGRALLPR